MSNFNKWAKGLACDFFDMVAMCAWWTIAVLGLPIWLPLVILWGLGLNIYDWIRRE